MYGKSSGGVTSYINDMESVSSSDAQKILNWHSTYNKLMYAVMMILSGLGIFEIR